MPTPNEERVSVAPSQWQDGIPDTVRRMASQGGELQEIVLVFKVPPKPNAELDFPVDDNPLELEDDKELNPLVFPSEE